MKKLSTILFVIIITLSFASCGNSLTTEQRVQRIAEREQARIETEQQIEEQQEKERLEAIEEEQERLAVTFDEIYLDYKANELRADDKYKYNRYRITAEINGMETGGLLNKDGGAVLTMQKTVGNTIVFFYAKFNKDQEPALKLINIGDTITFEGECQSAGAWIDCEMK